MLILLNFFFHVELVELLILALMKQFISLNIEELKLLIFGVVKLLILLSFVVVLFLTKHLIQVVLKSNQSIKKSKNLSDHLKTMNTGETHRSLKVN